MKTEILLPTEENIRLAAAEIKMGGLVAFPTETVYGLGADALNPAAARSIFAAKGRPSDNPLIVHLCKTADIEKVAVMTDMAKKAVDIFMPGPLTIILKKKPCVPDSVTGGLDTVAVRIPNHPVALRLLAECDTPVAAPSANTSTRPSPTRAAHVFADLEGKVRYILDGGSCDIGIESTILDLSGERIRLLRRGGVSEDILRRELGSIEVYGGGGDRPMSPGMKYRHYAPLAKVRLFEFGDKAGLLSIYNSNSAKRIKTLALMLSDVSMSYNTAQNCDKQNEGINISDIPNVMDIGREKLCQKQNIVVESNADTVVFSSVEEYANALFYLLRKSDETGCDEVLCELAPAVSIGESINNRLRKASQTEDEK